MNFRIAMVGALSIAWAVSGCSNIAPPATTRPANVAEALPADNDPVAARSLEEDLKQLSQSRAEGLISSADYLQGTSLKVAAAASQYMPTNGGSVQSLSAERLHSELSYLADMKRRNLLTDDQYDDIRHRLTFAFFVQNGLPYNQPGPLAQLQQTRVKGQFAKDLEANLLAIKASHADGVLNDTEYAQAIYRAMTPQEGNPIELDELKDEITYLKGMRSRGLLTAQRYDELRTTLVGRFIPSKAPFAPTEVPTSQPAGATH